MSELDQLFEWLVTGDDTGVFPPDSVLEHDHNVLPPIPRASVQDGRSESFQVPFVHRPDAQSSTEHYCSGSTTLDGSKDNAAVLNHAVWSRFQVAPGSRHSFTSIETRDAGGPTSGDTVKQKAMHSEANDPTSDDTKSGNKHDGGKKRCRNAEKHCIAERNRRGRINQKIQTLRSLIPNSSKMDMASVLGEAIDYVKSLQTHIREMRMGSRACSTSTCTHGFQSVHNTRIQLKGSGVGDGMSFDGNVDSGTSVSANAALVPSPMAYSTSSRTSTVGLLHQIPHMSFAAFELPHVPISTPYMEPHPTRMSSSPRADNTAWHHSQQFQVPNQDRVHEMFQTPNQFDPRRRRNQEWEISWF